MRHTRNRQQAKVSGKLFYLAYKSQEISKWNQYESALDKSFKWHRDFEGWRENWVEFGGDECSYGELIRVKGKNLHLK